MLRGLARLVVTALLVLSLTLSGWSLWRLAQDPLLRPMIEAQGDALAAAVDRAVARAATSERVAARLGELLEDSPRNWIAIDAVEEVAVARAVPLPPDLLRRIDSAHEEDDGWLGIAGRCAICAWDAGQCSLSQVFACHGPVAMTPIGDGLGIGRAGVAWATGSEIDQIDLALSAVGLGATALVLASGGSSLTLKAGASILKMARRMALLSPRLAGFILDAARQGIRWDRVADLDSLRAPARLIRPEVMRPLAALASDMGRIESSLGATRTLHLLRFVDTPGDARRLANLAEASGPKLLGAAELLGKSRLFRAGLRLADEAAALIIGLLGLAATLASALAGLVQGMALRRIRKGMRRRLSHR